jgi:hypothetical protein
MDKGQRSGKKKKKNQIRNIPSLPFNMLRKMPGALPNKKKGGNKKKGESEDGSKAGEVFSRAGEVPQLDSVGTAVQNINAEIGGEFELEVVLPFISEVEGQPPILQPVVPVSRDSYEAEKLVEIGVELGINFQGMEGEDVANMISMEERDRLEKEEWKHKRGDQ